MYKLFPEQFFYIMFR